MKRLLSLILAVLTIFSLSACSGRGYFGTNDNPPMKIPVADDRR